MSSCVALVIRANLDLNYCHCGNDAEKVWDALVLAIAAFDGLICGLGSRDTLRTEMGYPLHGHELSLDITPVQASASWAVGWKKDKFAGDSVLRGERTNGPRRFLHGLKSFLISRIHDEKSIWFLIGHLNINLSYKNKIFTFPALMF